MHVAKIEILQISEQESEQYTDYLLELLGTLRKNGQILGREYPISYEQFRITAYVNISSKNSLLLTNNNNYVVKSTKKISKNKEIKICVLGNSPDSKLICACSASEFYILITNYLSIESSLSCGTCYGSIPLPRLPKANEE